jgi:hypothetical protein
MVIFLQKFGNLKYSMSRELKNRLAPKEELSSSKRLLEWTEKNPKL